MSKGKNALKPSRSQRNFLKDNGIKMTKDDCPWLIQKDTPQYMQIIHKDTEEQRTIYK